MFSATWKSLPSFFTWFFRNLQKIQSIDSSEGLVHMLHACLHDICPNKFTCSSSDCLVCRVSACSLCEICSWNTFSTSAKIEHDWFRPLEFFFQNSFVWYAETAIALCPDVHSGFCLWWCDEMQCENHATDWEDLTYLFLFGETFPTDKWQLWRNRPRPLETQGLSFTLTS